MNNRLTAPSLVKVGYQNREDTYTGKLAYVIYQDSKKVWRKEGSWEGWRDKSIEPTEIENVPTSGFVLNKGVTRWHTERGYIRVWDPRGFEFEISIENLLFILSECDAYKGKGLDAEFVYAWSGQNLVLLPAHTQEYKDSVSFTKIKDKVVSAKKLVVGNTYLTSDLDKAVYLGKFPVNNVKNGLERTSHHDFYKGILINEILPKDAVQKRHVFVGNCIHCVNTTTTIKECIANGMSPYYNECYQEFEKSIYGRRFIEFVVKPFEIKEFDEESFSTFDFFKKVEGFDNDYILYEYTFYSDSTFILDHQPSYYSLLETGEYYSSNLAFDLKKDQYYFNKADGTVYTRDDNFVEFGKTGKYKKSDFKKFFKGALSIFVKSTGGVLRDITRLYANSDDEMVD